MSKDIDCSIDIKIGLERHGEHFKSSQQFGSLKVNKYIIIFNSNVLLCIFTALKHRTESSKFPDLMLAQTSKTIWKEEMSTTK